MKLNLIDGNARKMKSKEEVKPNKDYNLVLVSGLHWHVQ